MITYEELKLEDLKLYDTIISKYSNMLEDRDDLAVLWEIRVLEKYKHQEIEQHLFDMAVDFCKKINLNN